jgi:heme-degrading monooxygenase HmoA
VTQPGGPVASFTLTRYAGWRRWAGAFHMASQRLPLAREPGLRFFKLVGTGSGIGFSRTPDFALWGLFAVWESEAHWERFRTASRVMRQYRERGEETYSLLLGPRSAHGRWDGAEPFGELAPQRTPRDGDAPVAVLTRASIRPARQLRFWGAVPIVDRSLRGHPDVLLTFGVGEVPYLRQATISVWRSARAMREWAYGNPQHAEVVRRTRDEGWYSEDLFARFHLLRTYGTFNGADPLAVSAECGVRNAE